MDDAAHAPVAVDGVRELERARELEREVADERVRQAARGVAQQTAQIAAVDELEREEVPPLDGPEVQHLRDRRVREARGEARFVQEERDELGIVLVVREQPLQTDALLEPTGATPDADEGLRHAAGADAPHELVGAEARSLLRHGSWRRYHPARPPARPRRQPSKRPGQEGRGASAGGAR